LLRGAHLLCSDIKSSGNNAAAFANSTTSNQTSAGLNFNTKYDDALDPLAKANMDAAIANAFYIINTVHDFSYQYGFTKSAFNFQDNNFDKGGRGGDSVLMSVQDKSGLNGANFATPPGYVSIGILPVLY
jgi:extracellular elastinolytic metalloproteinase